MFSPVVKLKQMQGWAGIRNRSRSPCKTPAMAHMDAHCDTAEVMEICAERQHWMVKSSRRQKCHMRRHWPDINPSCIYVYAYIEAEDAG